MRSPGPGRRTSSVFVVIAAAVLGSCSSGGSAACTDSITAGCSLECSKSVDEYCATSGGCDLTWDAVLEDPALCGNPDPNSVNVWSSAIQDCGVYRVVQTGGEFGLAVGYYDKTTGALVAEIAGGHSQPLLSCAGGPLGRFTPPDCSGAPLAPPPLCAHDGGVDGP